MVKIKGSLTDPRFCRWWSRSQLRASVVVLPLNIFCQRYSLLSQCFTCCHVIVIVIVLLGHTCHMEEAVVGLGL